MEIASGLGVAARSKIVAANSAALQHQSTLTASETCLDQSRTQTCLRRHLASIQPKLTAGGSQPESGQATGKRQHKPLRARIYYDQPQGTGPGILSVKASLPGCTVGRRYGGMQFAGGGKTYRLRDVRVESCGGGTSAAPTERITFVYGTLDIK